MPNIKQSLYKLHLSSEAWSTKSISSLEFTWLVACSCMIVNYDHNQSGQYYKTMIKFVIYDTCPS